MLMKIGALLAGPMKTRFDGRLRSMRNRLRTVTKYRLLVPVNGATTPLSGKLSAHLKRGARPKISVYCVVGVVGVNLNGCTVKLAWLLMPQPHVGVTNKSPCAGSEICTPMRTVKPGFRYTVMCSAGVMTRSSSAPTIAMECVASGLNLLASLPVTVKVMTTGVEGILTGRSTIGRVSSVSVGSHFICGGVNTIASIGDVVNEMVMFIGCSVDIVRFATERL